MVSRMPLSKFEGMSLIVNCLYIYTIYRYLKVFFGSRRSEVSIEVLSYIGFYIGLAVVMLFFNRPIVNVSFTIVSFYLLSLNYNGSLKNRLMAVVSMTVTIFLTEVIAALLSGYFTLDSVYEINEFSSIAGLFLNKLICFIIVLIFENCNHVKKGIDIPNSRWFSIFFIPLGSFYIIFVILLMTSGKVHIMGASIVVLLGINIISFHLYDSLSQQYEERVQRLLLQQQNDYYLKQMEVMNSSYENVRSVRHDIKNHLIALESYIKQDDKDKAIEYIYKVIDASYGDKSFVSTGNIEIDSILNYKIEEARSKDIDFELDIKIPTKLNIDTLDIVGILGNLIDNAINANMKLEEDRRISLSLKYSKNLFFITIWNTFDGQVLYEDNKIATTHKDKTKHGIGLNNVNIILGKYDGTMEISHENKIFKVDILLYLI